MVPFERACARLHTHVLETHHEADMSIEHVRVSVWRLVLQARAAAPAGAGSPAAAPAPASAPAPDPAAVTPGHAKGVGASAPATPAVVLLSLVHAPGTQPPVGPLPGNHTHASCAQMPFENLFRLFHPPP
jgi:hypothetical protein